MQVPHLDRLIYSPPLGVEKEWLAELIAANPEPCACLIRITPALAKALIEINTHNRDVRRVRVAQMEKDMLAGRWLVNGEAISISRTGVITDGGHRITSIDASGATIVSFVVLGLADEAQYTIDLVGVRNTSDMLQLEGTEDHKIRSAATAWFMQWEQYGKIHTEASYRPTTPMIMARAKGMESMFDEALAAIPPMGKPIIRRSVCVAFYLMARSRGVKASDITEFTHKLLHGEMLQSGDPVFAARERLISSRTRTHALLVPHQFELLARTWNAARLGEQRAKVQLMGNMPDLAL